EQSPADFQEAFLKTVFNFTGVNDIEVIRAEGVNMGEAVKAQALQTALQQVQAI
ncbi:FMN-dependent NADH-azoreductase, partial [Yersinia pestis]